MWRGKFRCDRLLVETDSPFLAPQPHRGRRNEPAYVAEVARTIGNVRNLPADEVAEATSANFRRFFGLAAIGKSHWGSSWRGVISLLTAKEIFDLVRDDLVKVEQELDAPERLGHRAGGGDFQLPAGRRRQAAASGAAAAFGGLRGIPGRQRDSAGRGRGADPQRHADSRRRDRWREHAPRAAVGEFPLGQSPQRAGGRLAVHAVVSDGAYRAQFQDSGRSDRTHAKHGGRRTGAAGQAWAHGFDRTGRRGTRGAQDGLLVRRMRAAGRRAGQSGRCRRAGPGRLRAFRGTGVSAGG